MVEEIQRDITALQTENMSGIKMEIFGLLITHYILPYWNNKTCRIFSMFICN